MSLYYVEYTAAKGLATGVHRPPAWRVIVNHAAFGVDEIVLTPGFARQKDAEMAKRALLHAGMDTFEKLNARADEVERVMAEALQW